MFDSITLHGTTATLVWGYRTVAELTAWRITKADKRAPWRLTATIVQADRLPLERRDLHKDFLFTAPRDKGRWAFGIAALHLVGPSELRATLGPPEGS